MSDGDGFVSPVQTANREAYCKPAEEVVAACEEYVATGVLECWSDDGPERKLSSLPMAVKCAQGERVVFSWITWPLRALPDEGWKKLLADPRMRPGTVPMPFDGKRRIYGGFEVLRQV